MAVALLALVLATTGTAVAAVNYASNSGKVDGKTAGHRRWYWQARGAGLPFMEVNEDTHGRLERGDLAIVESPRGDAWLVDSDTARRLGDLDPAWIRVWNGRA